MLEEEVAGGVIIGGLLLAAILVGGWFLKNEGCKSKRGWALFGLGLAGAFWVLLGHDLTSFVQNERVALERWRVEKKIAGKRGCVPTWSGDDYMCPGDPLYESLKRQGILPPWATSNQ